MRASLLTLDREDDRERRQEVLGELYVGLHSIISEAERAGLKLIFQLASAAGKLIRKVLEKPASLTPSVLHALGAAIELLERLCPACVELDISTAPIRTLVVDDDPVARRAISSALQLTFAKPEVVESGEAAVELAASEVFDVIFLDVLMPGMDGFAACAQIREASPNETTPIVFVTSYADAASREKSVRCGGNGFISKPVLPAEISLTALTFAVRARIDRTLSQPEKSEPTVCQSSLCHHPSG